MKHTDFEGNADTMFKGYNVVEILDETDFCLKAVVEKKLASKLDGMYNTDEAFIVNEETVIYYVKGLYHGFIGSFDVESVTFVIVNGDSIGWVAE